MFIKPMRREDNGYGIYHGFNSNEIKNETELYTIVCISAIDEEKYALSAETVKILKDLINKLNPDFVAKTAVYASEQMHLNIMPLVLAILLNQKCAKDVNIFARKTGYKKLHTLLPRLIKEAAQIQEILRIYQTLNVRRGYKRLNRIASQIKKTLGQIFEKFDENQFAKCNKNGHPTINDAIALLHPKPQDDERAGLYKKIMQGALAAPFSVADILKEEEQKGLEPKDIWENLISTNKLDYLNLLLNLKNILDADIGKDCLKIVMDRISDVKEAGMTNISPFTFLSAFLNIHTLKSFNASRVKKTIENVLNVSMDNITFFNGQKSVIASDVSGSMYCPVNEKNKMEFFDIGLFISMMLKTNNPDTIAGIFGDSWLIKDFPTESIPSNVRMCRNLTGKVGYSANASKVLEWALNEGVKADMFLFFTDRQVWDGHLKSSGMWNVAGMQNENVLEKYWTKYKFQINAGARLFAFALGMKSQFPLKILKNDIYLINGWSDKIFDVLEAIEKRENNLEEINRITF